MKSLLILFCILLLSFGARLFYFTRPVADWHSWRQSDTSAVSRNFVKYGFDILHPRFDDFSKGVSLIDNPHGYRFVEFPIYNILQAGFFKFFGYFTIEEWGRLVTIFSQLISVVFIFLLMKRYTNERSGLIAAAFYGLTPYNIYWGRTILPDSTTVTALLGSLYFFGHWIENQSSYKNFFIALLFTISAILLKPYALFFLIPPAYLAFKKFRFKMFFSWKLILFAFISLVPFVLWRLWMQHYPEGIPQNNWLFNGTNIRFKGAFFQWLFADRIAREILGYYGIAFVIAGIISKTKREGLLYHSFLISAIIYMVVIATGNVQHDYYQILIIPTIAFFFGKGIDIILTETKSIFSAYASYAVILVSVLFMLAFSWYIVRDFYNLQHDEVLLAAAAVDRLTPKDAKIIAPYGGDTTFLYNTNRQGWPVFDRTIGEFIKNGASYIAFAKPKEDELGFSKLFKPVQITPDYAIFDLSKPTALGELEIKKK